MKANELRIGNYVEVFVSFCLIKEEQVIDIMCDSINTKSHENMTFDYIEPIPLTEDWLLKFGFKMISKHQFRKGIWGCDLRTKSFFKYMANDKINHIADCEYVNQLQNLYFALTGEELKYNHLK